VFSLFNFKHDRIRTKLSVVITQASLLVLVLVCLAFGGIRFFELRREASRDLQNLLIVLNDRLAEALLSSDRISGQRFLHSLRWRNSIGAAYLFDRNHVPFAESFDGTRLHLVESKIRQDFVDGVPASWRELRDVAVHYDLTSLRLFAPVIYEHQYLGGVYLLSDLKQQNRELVEIALMLLGIGGVAIGFAWKISDRLQRPISEPILQLAGLTQTILHSHNYSLRGRKYTHDEIGLLVDGFNNMLGQIESRQKELVEHRAQLEQKVLERTADLTQSVRALQEARLSADQANQAKSTFLANMTHELRTPLVGVLGMNELLHGTVLDDNQRYFVDAVQRSGYELLEMIDQILEFSRIESGRLSLQTRAVDLPQLVEEVILLLAERVYAKGLDLIWRIEPEAMCVVKADAQRVKQILVNLMGNAIKFTAQGQVALEVRAEGDFFLFCVRDSGVGIAREQQSRIFESFRQADESVARVYGGTGLGLSIVKELTLLMGGELHLDSVPEAGSCFEIRLPLPWLNVSPSVLPEPLKGARLALLEPAVSVRRGLGQLLTDLGFSVDFFASAEELLKHSSASPQSGFFYKRIVFSSRLNDGEVRVLSEKIGHLGEKILRLQRTLPSAEPKVTAVDEIYEPCLGRKLVEDFRVQATLDPLSVLSCAVQGESV
jgi:signal transduction histidine kinase